MSVTDFLKGLPSHDAQNFSQFCTEGVVRNTQKRASVYLPTEDFPDEQHIVMDKRCVLLRYLTQQWDKKILPRKREHGNGGGEANGTPTGNTNCKKRRLDGIVDLEPGVRHLD